MAKRKERSLFEREKTIEAILYLSKNIEIDDYTRISKLLFFADKTHLEQYARTITNDSYIAGSHGIYPEKTLELLRNPQDDKEFMKNPAFKNEYGRIIGLREYNPDYMSESDIKALRETLEVFGAFPTWHLCQISQDEAWRKAWKNQWRHQPMPDFYQVNMLDIIESVDDIDGNLIDHLTRKGVQADTKKEENNG